LFNYYANIVPKKSQVPFWLKLFFRRYEIYFLMMRFLASLLMTVLCKRLVFNNNEIPRCARNDSAATLKKRSGKSGGGGQRFLASLGTGLPPRPLFFPFGPA
jgi:hypothetical protein